MHKFDRDTALERIGDNRFRGSLSRDWWIVKGPNGGYLAAIILRSMILTVADRERSPRSLTIHYLKAPEEGPIELATHIERSGRSLSTITATMTQKGEPTTLAIAAFGVPVLDYEFQDISPPQVDPPDACPSRGEKNLVPIGERLDLRLAIGGQPWQGNERALAGGWMRLIGEREPDSVLLAMLADAWFPPIFARETGGAFAGAVPTIDLTIHFRTPFPLPSSKPDDFYLGRFESTTARQGYIEESGELWSKDGRLLLQSRQLSLLF